MALLSQVIESFWGMGYTQEQLAGLTGLTGDINAFKREMARLGITEDQFQAASRLADWRPDNDRTPVDNAREMLRILGLPAHGGTAEEIIASVATVNPQMATNLSIKVGRPVSQGLPTWNPFRGDAKDHGMGVAAPAAPQSSSLGGPRMQITGPTRPEPGLRPGTGIAPATTSGSSIPGFPGPRGPGSPGGGRTPITAPVEQPLTPEQRRDRIAQSYGWAAGLMDIPEVATILNDVANGTITEIEADRRFRSSNYYKTTSAAAREWKIYTATAGAEDVAKFTAENFENLRAMAKEAGIANPDEERLARLNDTILSQGWSDAQVRRALAAEVLYDPTGTQTGVLADMKNITREWLVPLSDQAMSAWARSIVEGSKTLEDFTEYNRTQAKSLFPALSTALDDPNMTTRTYMDPYAQDTASVLGINAADIDWTSPKWMRAFNQIDPKTNERTVMSRSDWMRTVMKDPTYGYEQSTNGQAAKQNLTMGLLEMFGFPAGGR